MKPHEIIYGVKFPVGIWRKEFFDLSYDAAIASDYMVNDDSQRVSNDSHVVHEENYENIS